MERFFLHLTALKTMLLLAPKSGLVIGQREKIQDMCAEEEEEGKEKVCEPCQLMFCS